MARVNTRSGEAGRRPSRAQGAGGRKRSNRRAGPLLGHWPAPAGRAQPAENALEDLVVIEVLHNYPDTDREFYRRI